MSVPPRPSATACVLHQAESGFSVLMVLERASRAAAAHGKPIAEVVVDGD